MRRLAYLGVALVGLAAVWLLAVPAVATRAGWATRWPLRLPATIHLHGRAYGNPGACVARRRTPFVQHRAVKVGTVSVVLGDDIPVFETAPSPSGSVGVAVAARLSSGCYIVYGLEGGP